MALGKKLKYSLGDVVAIPLADTRFAYAKILRDSDFAIYDFISEKIEVLNVVVQHPISFYQASTDEAVKNGLWPLIGNDAFQSSEDEWGPPRATCYSRETNEWTMGRVPRIDHKGQMRVATLSEVQGLDVLSVCNRPDQILRIINDRLVNGNHADYKVVE
jgi:Immunity protein 26